MLKFFTTYIRPILEFNSQVWSPCSSHDIALLEGVQRFFTSRMKSCNGLPYHVRLARLSLHSLQHRRTVADLSTLHSIISSRFDLPLSRHLCFLPPSVTRGHNLKLLTPPIHYLIHTQNFLTRTIRLWNSLPLSLLSSSSSITFRQRLSDYLSDPFLPPFVPP